VEPSGKGDKGGITGSYYYVRIHGRAHVNYLQSPSRHNVCIAFGLDWDLSALEPGRVTAIGTLARGIEGNLWAEGGFIPRYYRELRCDLVERSAAGCKTR
jgi:hypothetical protein